MSLNVRKVYFVELVIIFIVAICLLWYLSSRDRATQSRIEDLSLQLGEAKSKIENLQQEVEDLKAEVEEMSSTEEEKEARFFRSLPDLNASFFKSLQKGQVLDLISGSYHYPHDEMFVIRFQYKHDNVKKESESENWPTFEVHGFKRLSSDDEWSPCMMLASDASQSLKEECQTWDRSGTVKKMSGSF